MLQLWSTCSKHSCVLPVTTCTWSWSRRVRTWWVLCAGWAAYVQLVYWGLSKIQPVLCMCIQCWLPRDELGTRVLHAWKTQMWPGMWPEHNICMTPDVVGHRHIHRSRPKTYGERPALRKHLAEDDGGGNLDGWQPQPSAKQHSWLIATWTDVRKQERKTLRILIETQVGQLILYFKMVFGSKPTRWWKVPEALKESSPVLWCSPVDNPHILSLLHGAGQLCTQLTPTLFALGGTAADLH